MSRKYHLLNKFGITAEQYDDLLQEQGECCGVCKRHCSEFKQRLAVDHDHRTGQIRGLLCIYCNRYSVGRHRRETIQAVYDYLGKEYPGWVVPPKKKRRKKRAKKRLARKSKLQRTRPSKHPSIHPTIVQL